MTGDFLRKNAQTPLREHFIAAGAICSFSTNSEALLQAARDCFLPVASAAPFADFSVRFWVDDASPAQPPWPKPYVRGLDHLVFAGFDAGSSMLADLRSRRVIGRFSAQMAADSAHWKTIIFPILLTIVTPSVGVAELHCACVAKGEGGLLLAGPSGSGKSSQAVALSQRGFRFLSDDRTFCSSAGELVAWGLPTPLKLRAESGQWFPQLGDRPNGTQKGEPVFWLDPEDALGIQRAQRCQPRALIFLDRMQDTQFNLSRLSSVAAMSRLQTDLMAALPDESKKQSETLASLVALPCWLLQYCGSPQAIAQNICDHFEQILTGNRNHSKAVTPAETAEKHEDPDHACSQAQRPDPLRRFAPTPYRASLSLMNRTVRLETNDPMVHECVMELFANDLAHSARRTDFLWRIVIQPHPNALPPWPQRWAFSGPRLRFAQFGQTNFLAVDLEARQAIGFLAEGLAGDKLGFTSPFLDNLFCLTAGALGLVALRANCVALGDQGLILFGSPNSGKTTASYLAAGAGLQFHADEGVFLELNGDRLHAWGGFWPAAFRAETLQHLPELQSCASPFFYRDFTFHHLEKSRLRAAPARPVVPVCCVFLAREATTEPVVSLISPQNFSRLLEQNKLFLDDDQFHGQEVAVLARLAELPAYHLAYGSDPTSVTEVIRQLLFDHAEPGASAFGSAKTLPVVTKNAIAPGNEP